MPSHQQFHAVSSTKDSVALSWLKLHCREKSLSMRIVLVAALAVAPLLSKGNDSVKRLNEASAVFSEIMAAPDKGIPKDMLANAHCIVIVPGLKTAAFVFGGKYGK